jgi:transcriptional regulator with XRE-family HTH domain
MSMVELAHRIGVQHSAIYKYEKGIVTNIPKENIEKIASVFDIPPCELVDWLTEDPMPDLTTDERAFITLYRKLTERNQQAVKSYLDFILSTQGK